MSTCVFSGYGQRLKEYQTFQNRYFCLVMGVPYKNDQNLNMFKIALLRHFEIFLSKKSLPNHLKMGQYTFLGKFKLMSKNRYLAIFESCVGLRKYPKKRFFRVFPNFSKNPYKPILQWFGYDFDIRKISKCLKNRYFWLFLLEIGNIEN